jgi:glutamate racemase
MSGKRKPTIINSVRKALLILDTFLEQRRPLGVTETSELLGFSFSTTHHLMSTLKAGGYVTQNINDKKYKLGIKSFQLGLIAQNTFQGLIERGSFVLEDLATKINEDCYLVLLEGQEIVYVAKSLSSHAMRFSPKLGTRDPVFQTAAGKVFLAFNSKEITWDNYGNSINDMGRADYEQELNIIKEQGYAIDKERSEEGLVTIAAPVRNHTGEICAVLSISGLASRIAQKEENILEETIKYANKLSVDLGYTKWSASFVQQQNKTIVSQAPIGILDTGVGGLAMVRELLKKMPHESILYLGDTERSPYGPRPLGEIRRFVLEGCRFLINGGAKVLLIACTSSSVAGEHAIRRTYQTIPTVGMVEASVKATLGIGTNVVAVLGTKATIESKIFDEAFNKINPGLKVMFVQTNKLLDMAGKGGEAAGFSKEAMLKLTKTAVDCATNKGADSILLASSDFPCISHIVKEVSYNRVNIIDPTPAAVAEIEKILVEKGISANSTQSPVHEYFVTGYDNELFESMGKEFLGMDMSVQKLTFNRINCRDIQ